MHRTHYITPDSKFITVIFSQDGVKYVINDRYEHLSQEDRLSLAEGLTQEFGSNFNRDYPRTNSYSFPKLSDRVSTFNRLPIKSIKKILNKEVITNEDLEKYSNDLNGVSYLEFFNRHIFKLDDDFNLIYRNVYKNVKSTDYSYNWFFLDLNYICKFNCCFK